MPTWRRACETFSTRDPLKCTEGLELGDVLGARPSIWPALSFRQPLLKNQEGPSRAGDDVIESMVFGLIFQPSLERTPHFARARAVRIEIGKPFGGKPIGTRQMLCNYLSTQRGPFDDIERPERVGLIRRDTMSITAKWHGADLGFGKAEDLQIMSKMSDPRSRPQLAGKRRKCLQVLLPHLMKA